jgi:hypothetical protein
MLIRLNSGIATGGPAFLPGDLVDWKPDGEAQRMCEANLAAKTDVKECQGQKVHSYTSPPAKEGDKWPPKPAPKKIRDRDRGRIED